MIPATSTLNWSYERPTFEEVKGAILLVVNDEDELPEVTGVISNEIEYNYWFNDPDCPFTKMAIVELSMPAPEVEPMELWGVKPVIVKSIIADIFYVHYGQNDEDCWYIGTPEYPTRLEAVTAWNRIATALSQAKE